MKHVPVVTEWRCAMAAEIFTAKQWQTAEQWNNGWLFVMVVVILIVIIHLQIVGFYIHEHWKWWLIVPFALVCIGLAGFSWARTDNAANVQFNQWATKITPQIRTKKPALFKYVPVPIDEIRTYEGLNDYPTLTTLPMYTRHQITAPVTYLGRDAHEAYFKFRGLVYRYAGPTHIGQVAALVGYRFHLKDRGYAQLGFIDPVKTFTATLVIPRAQASQQYTPTNEVVVTLDQMGGEWTTEKVYHG